MPFALSVRIRPREQGRHEEQVPRDASIIHVSILVRHGVDDNVRNKPKCIGGIFAGIFGIIRPFETVSEIRIPRHEHDHAASLIEDTEVFGDSPGRSILPLVAFRTFGDGIVGDLNDLVDIVEAMK